MRVYTVRGPAGHVRLLHQPVHKWSLLLRLVHQVRPAWVALLAVSLLAAHQARGTEIWNGPAISFTNAVGSDPTDPASQDRLTFNVWLTRGSTHGLYNAAVETSYSSLSPVGTEWAYGALPDYASLIYEDWVVWNGKNPPSMVGKDAVLHLIPDDVYLAVRFTSWSIGAGGFSYSRSTAPVPEPPAALVLLSGTAVAAAVRFYRWRPRAASGAKR